MPNANRDQTVYVVTGNPDTLNVATADWLQQRPAELGCAFDHNNMGYQFVLVDSGCTAATNVGVVAANQLAFWKDKTIYLVTNDRAQAIGGGPGQGTAWMNQVAGVFRNAVSASHMTAILQRGDNIPVCEANNVGAVGQTVIAENAATAGVAFIAVGGAITYQKIGVARGVGAAGSVRVDVDIPNIP